MMKLDTLRVDFVCDLCGTFESAKPETESGEMSGYPETPIPGWQHTFGDFCPECVAKRIARKRTS